MMPEEYESHRLRVAAALRELERALTDLALALGHEDAEIQAEHDTGTVALRRVCDAYTTIDLPTDGAPNQSIVAVAVVGVNRDVVRLAERINGLKAALKRECAPLQRIRRRVPRRDGGTEAVPVARAILRSLQRSDLNLLAAYRKIPILDAAPASVSYTRARTRAVYRKTVAEIGDLLQNNDGAAAMRDRERLGNLPPQETHLALVRDHYENLRANIVYSTHDARGRARVMISAELPILYERPPGANRPVVTFPETGRDTRNPRKARASRLEPQPWLESLPVHRYLTPKPSRGRH